MSEPNDSSRAVAYLRRSRVDETRTGAVSYEAQEAAVRTVARRWGYEADLPILVDWGRSGGRGSEHRRTSYLKLRQLIDSGQVTDVFSYDLARLTRSLTEWTRLADLSSDRGVRIHLVKEGDFDFSTASGEMLANILASVAQAVRRWASERSKETITSLRARGQAIGQKPYGSRPGEDLAFVTAAFTEAGTFYGAARLLNERHIPTLKGKGWTQSAVAWILRHQAPELVTVHPATGGPARAGRFVLSKLVRCHCGRLLTPYSYANGKNPTYTVYRCNGGRTDPTHPQPYAVTEPVLLEWAKDEAAHLAIPASTVELVSERSSERAELDERRARILDMFEAGHVTRDEREARLAPIYDALERLDREAGAVSLAAIPEIDWSWPAERLNAVLRAIWERIELGPDLRPIRAKWLVPEWRAP
jgi:DNA invertase Pin-like site-specific DNA recombinase